MKTTIRWWATLPLIAGLAIGCAEQPAEKGVWGMTSHGHGAPGPERQLDGLKAKPAWMTHMGCLIGCAEYLNTGASPAWIYGGSGHAFALNIHEAICPSGPTAWPADECDRLAANVGLKVEGQGAPKEARDFAVEKQKIWQAAQAAIDGGMPCFGWDLAVPEWYVVFGYDGEGNYLFRDHGDKVGKKHYARLGVTEIGWACVKTVRPCAAADDRVVVREALRFALGHTTGAHDHEKWHSGLGGYDVWIAALGNAELIRTDKVVGFGQAYNAQCWAECRRHAVAFLVEARTKLADPKLAPDFDEAIKQYKVVAASLKSVAEAFPFKHDDMEAMNARIAEPARRQQAARALTAARDAERAGLKALARIAVALGAKDVDVEKIGAAPAGG
jgi:hypothetical protein